MARRSDTIAHLRDHEPSPRERRPGAGRGAPRTLWLAQFILLGRGLSLGAPLYVAVPEGSIDAFVDPALPDSGAPGLAYAIAADGELQTVGARGVVELRGGQEVTSDTPFPIGSISWIFTALAIMQPVETGPVDPDGGLSRHLDAFASGLTASVAIRRLLGHMSGYRAQACSMVSTHCRDIG